MSSLALNEEESHKNIAGGGRKKLQKNITGNTSGAWIDEERQNLRAYEYLCHVGEAKEWIEACISEDIGAITDLDQNLRNGVILAKLAKFFEPGCVKKIFEDAKLQFRHSDNTNYFFAACKKSGLPDLFLFELTDVYDKKNIPKVIYCIHALSHYLAKKGIAPKIKNLVGKLDFTDEELQKTENSLQEAGVALPQFGNIEGALAKELQEESEEEKREKYLKEHDKEIVKCQSVVRGYIARSGYKKRIEELKKHEDFIIKVQSQIRQNKQRKLFLDRREKLKQCQDFIVKLQTEIRGKLIRQKLLERRINFEENGEQIVKLQANFKRKLVQEAYEQLQKHPENIQVKAIRQMIDLLTGGDSEQQQFQEELQLEQLRQLMLKKIRDNSQTEQLLNDLDIKIALLVKNRITLDELTATMNQQQQQQQQQAKESKEALTSTEDLLNLKSLDKESRNRLELYQSMFYLLQTQPQYLARAMFSVKQTKIKAFMDHVLLTIFNYANSKREEYLLLRLFQQSISEELKSIGADSGEIMKGNPLFVKMVVNYNRGAKERLFLRDLLQPLVKEVLQQSNEMDLETDPLVIYRLLIKEEELKTGEQSKRPYDVSREQAMEDQETKQLLEKHLLQLKQQTLKFLDAITKSFQQMPYGLKFIAQQLMLQLKQKFPQEEERQLLKVVGNLLYYRYMNPAIVAPEGFDVIEQLISPQQRKNLAEIAKLLQQVAAGKPFDQSQDGHLAQLNDYIQEQSLKMFEFYQKCLQIPSAEEYFQMSDLSDLLQVSKPVIYITQQEIYNTHALLASLQEDLCPSQTDSLRLVLQKLGPVPDKSVSVDYSGQLPQQLQSSNAGESVPSSEISLYLNPSKILAKGDGGGDLSNDLQEYKNLLIEVKHQILILIKCQSGKNLVEVLTANSNQKNPELIFKKLNEKKSNQSTDFQQFKKQLLQSIERLELLFNRLKSVDNQKQLGIIPVDRRTNYQELLTSLAIDLRNQNLRKQQRRSEIQQLQKTIANLDEKMKYLQEQKQSYQDYINSCMAALTSNRKKQSKEQQKFLMPFSPQWKHMQDLKKAGKVPQFGSFKYSADHLYKKGVLVSVDGYSPKQFDKISLTISSDETGIFVIEVSILGIKMPQKMELKLEDLLQYQFDNVQVIPLFDGAAKVNVNLLIFLINKKFYN